MLRVTTVGRWSYTCTRVDTFSVIGHPCIELLVVFSVADVKSASDIHRLWLDLDRYVLNNDGLLQECSLCIGYSSVFGRRGRPCTYTILRLLMYRFVSLSVEYLPVVASPDILCI